MKQALIVWGGWSGHEPEQCAAVLSDMLREEGFKEVSMFYAAGVFRGWIGYA